MKNILYTVIIVLAILVLGAAAQESIIVVYGWGSNGPVPLNTDDASSSLAPIMFEHHEVHEGDHYLATDSAIVANAAVREYLLVTPNTTKWCHLIFIATGTLTTTVELFETSTKTANTDIVEVNSNRNSANVAGLSITHTPGGAGDGTRLYISAFGLDAGGGATRIIQGGVARGTQELMLKQNTKYLLRITSGTDDNLTSIFFSWYEHTNDN